MTYEDVGRRWIKLFDIKVWQERRDLTGVAWVYWRAVAAPWPPTTRKRLYFLAHEIGHILLDHRGQRPPYVQEFEAEIFAHKLLEREDIPVPESMTKRAKAYVFTYIKKRILRGLWVDPDITNWAAFGGSKLWLKEGVYIKSMNRVDRIMETF